MKSLCSLSRGRRTATLWLIPVFIFVTFVPFCRFLPKWEEGEAWEEWAVGGFEVKIMKIS